MLQGSYSMESTVFPALFRQFLQLPPKVSVGGWQIGLHQVTGVLTPTFQIARYDIITLKDFYKKSCLKYVNNWNILMENFEVDS